MLKISKLTDYAIIILGVLARQPEDILSATTIAKKIHLSSATVSKILKMLCEKEIVTSFRGTGGGYRLKNEAEKINIADIIIALEGQIALTECCAQNQQCTLDTLCSVKDNWKVINKIILSALANVRLDDMIRPLKMKGLVHGE